MKILVIYASIHHGNTKKVAEKIGKVLDAKIVDVSQAGREDIREADLVGFGSGIYFSKFHKELSRLVDGLPAIEGKRAFIFSTSGMKAENILNIAHGHFKKKLIKKGFRMVGEFNCPGYDTYSVLKAVGGVNKNRPGTKDLERAEKFAESLLNKK